MQTITVTNTDCFQLAAQYLNDATQFIRIMQENGLTDPQIVGPLTITIPDIDPTQTGGVPIS